ncbi:MAG: CHAT domain-containing protein [Anaerolineae bacterium]|nr:CHAT domain-containing protein [Anaerolineae bacterium]
MTARIDSKGLSALIEQVKSFQTTRFSGFGYWHRGLDPVLVPEEGPLFQLYAGLGVVVRDMWVYLNTHPRDDAQVFKTVIQPIIEENREQYPKTTIFHPMVDPVIPDGFAQAAVEGYPTVAGLDDWNIVHEWTTKPGKKAFYGFYQVCRDQLCGAGGPYEILQQDKVDENELGMTIARVFQRECFSASPAWEPLLAFLATCAIRKEIETMCELTTVLFLSANPTDTARLRLGEELREIREKLQLANLRDRFDLVDRTAVRPEDLSLAMLSVNPQVVHFSGHGTATGSLCLEDVSGKLHRVQPEALAALFEQFAGKVQCVVLNACYAEIQANAIARHIDYVIGMNQTIGDSAAIAFAIGFYQALGEGKSFDEAYKFGCIQIGLQNIPEHLTPVLIKKERLHA